jgi:hypothetical protein
MNNTKYKIAKLIDSQNLELDNPSYDRLLESIYNNSYKAILKAPTDLFLLGSLTHFVIKDVTHANEILDKIKEVVQEALEYSGFELNCTDPDWHNLTIFQNNNWGGWKLSKSKDEFIRLDKGYMSEFFDI